MLKSILIFLSLRLGVFARVFVFIGKHISLLLFAATLIPLQAVAQDTLGNVLERIRVQETRHFSYRETRNLALLAEPWQASGDMYTSPQQMVIAQQTPTPVLTVISAGRMLHIDTRQDINRSLTLEQPFAVPGMEPFMLLLYGATGRTELAQDYVISFDSTGQRWSLQLAPRQQAEDGIIHMNLSGDSDHGPDQLVLEHADGDRTEWQLSLVSQGETASHELRQLLESIH
ncbi:MAG: hypothetical protein ABFS24_02740 [Pseudomonadota bacterium]